MYPKNAGNPPFLNSAKASENPREGSEGKSESLANGLPGRMMSIFRSCR
jgi:hypothetical protein